MIIEIGKFFIYAILIVLLSKILLAKSLRGIAENLKLKPRIVGGITGIATSIPEFLTVTVSSFKGLSSTSLYNIFSSNVINFIQYIVSILINKNYKEIKNRAIIIQLGIAIFTIVMPIFLLKYEKKINIYFAILFIIIYFLFSWIIKNIHYKYLKDYEEKIEEDQMIKEIKKEHNHKKTYVYFLLIIIAGILLCIYINYNFIRDFIVYNRKCTWKCIRKAFRNIWHCGIHFRNFIGYYNKHSRIYYFF